MSKVAIIGGGLVGTSVAYHLLQHGFSVSIVDREDAGQATAAAAGILPPLDHFIGVSAVLPLLQAARNFYPELARELREQGEHDIGYDVVGALEVATSKEGVEQLSRVAAACEQRRDAGFAHIGDVTRLDGAGARELFPLLGPGVLGAIHCSGAARIDGRRLLAALRALVLRLGGELRRGSAALWNVDGQTCGVKVDSERLSVDAVVVAAGAWSRSVVAPLGLEISVRPQRGQLVHLELPGVDTGGWPIVLGHATNYLLGFPQSRIVAGATREDEVGYDCRPTAGGIHAVLGSALRLAPGLARATLSEARVGFRPVSADRKPILGASVQYRNLFFATGHAGYGLEVGPYSGALVADLIAERPLGLDLTPFAPERFEKS